MARRLRRLLVLTPQPAQPANSEIARRLRRMVALGAAFWGVAGAFFRPSLRANSEFAGCAGCGVWRGGGGRGGGQAGQARQARPGRRASRPGQPASFWASQQAGEPGGWASSNEGSHAEDAGLSWGAGWEGGWGVVERTRKVGRKLVGGSRHALVGASKVLGGHFHGAFERASMMTSRHL